MKKIFKFLLVLFLCYSANVQIKGQPTNFFYDAQVLVAPEKILHGINNIAILDFENDNSYNNQFIASNLSSKLPDLIIKELLEEQRGARRKNMFIKGARTDIFNIIERSRIHQVLNEQSLQNSGSVNKKQAVKIGRVLGVDAILMGSFSFTCDDKRSRYTTKDTLSDGSPTLIYHYWVTRTLNAEATMRLVSVETGEILAVFNPVSSASDHKTSTYGYPGNASLTSVDVLANQAFKSVASQCVNYISPRFIPMRMYVEKIKIRDHRKVGRKAFQYLSKGDIRNAYSLYKTICEKDAYNPRAHYNIGTIYEVIADYEKAVEQYEKALKLDRKNKLYKSAIQRARNGLSLINELSNKGIRIQQHNFGPSGVISQKITIRGGKGSRVKAFSKPKYDSETVAKVPGGLTFDVLEKEGDWYKVELLDGSIAYFNKKYVKKA